MRKVSVFALFVGAVFVSGLSFAGGNVQVKGEALKALFNDMTQHCDQVGKDKTCKTYNGTDGRIGRVMDADGKQRVGDWWVTEDSEYCVHWDIKDYDLCFTVIDMGDGTYEMYKKGKLKALIRKLEPGNPFDIPTAKQ